MENLGNVQEKVSCIFDTKVVEEQSSKRTYQPYKVVATDLIRQDAQDSCVVSSRPSEKLDGTCVYVREFQGRPWLWARHDRKPNKASDKKFKRYQNLHRAWQLTGKNEACEPIFTWNVDRDFRDVPSNWIPAAGVKIIDGQVQPDNNGHIPGWVPVDPTARQHCWHLTTVDLEAGLALILAPLGDDRQEIDETILKITCVQLSDLLESTLELIGTNINANPYNIGSKQHPVHLLVRHGSIAFHKKPPLNFEELKQWFHEDPEGQVEGIVWHCPNGRLFKLHRYHLGLPWPVCNLRLQSCHILINIDLATYETQFQEKSLFLKLGNLHGQTFDSLKLVQVDTQ